MGVEGAVQVDRHHAAPFVRGDVEKRLRAAPGDAGVGEAGIEAAEAFERRGHGGVDRGGIGDVALEGPEPQSGNWPDPVETTLPEEWTVYPGEGTAFSDEGDDEGKW